MSISTLMMKIIFMKYLPPVMPELAPKWKMLRIYWNLAHLIFQICRYWFWCQKWFLWSIYHLLGSNWFQIKSAQNLLKFGTFDVSNVLISILMWKIIFMKYLPIVWPKEVTKSKNLRIYWGLIEIYWKLWVLHRFW